MFVTGHAAIGAILSRVCPTPSKAFGAGVLSHFAADAIPHWGTRDRSTFLRIARIDGLTMLATSAALVMAAQPANRMRIAAGILGAGAPDFDKPARELGITLFPHPVNRFHAGIQREDPKHGARDAAIGAGLTVVAFLLERRSRT